jgi:hypothetical protein
MLGYLNDFYVYDDDQTGSVAAGSCPTQSTQLEVRQQGSVIPPSAGGSGPVVAIAVSICVVLVIAAAVAAFFVYRHLKRKRLAAQAARVVMGDPGSPMSPTSPGSPTALNPNKVEMREIRAGVARSLDFDK